jgi:hypothetical protein
MSTVSLVYIGPATQVLVPALDANVQRGVPVEVPADLAGVAPGPWQPATADDPPGWLWRDGADGVLEVHDPGRGLLAQVDNWAPAGSAAAKAALKVHAEFAKLPEGTFLVGEPGPETVVPAELTAVVTPADTTPEA